MEKLDRIRAEQEEEGREAAGGPTIVVPQSAKANRVDRLVPVAAELRDDDTQSAGNDRDPEAAAATRLRLLRRVLIDRKPLVEPSSDAPQLGHALPATYVLPPGLGRVTLYDHHGTAVTCQPVDARELLSSGDYVLEPPDAPEGAAEPLARVAAEPGESQA